MKQERWHEIEDLYHSASTVPDDQRDAFLQQACGGDRSLFREVDSLLRYGSSSQSVLDTPAIAMVAKAIARMNTNPRRRSWRAKPSPITGSSAPSAAAVWEWSTKPKISSSAVLSR